MSQFKTVLVKDDTLCISDSIGFAVEKGAQNVSLQKFVATSANSNSHVYTIQVPSISVVVDRELLWHCQFAITVSGVPAVGEYLINLGYLDGLAAFPLHQLVTNMTCAINNTTVSMPTNRLIDPIMRCMDRDRLSNINNFSPCYLDNVGNYKELDVSATGGQQNASQYINNPFGGYNNAVNATYQPRGVYQPVSVVGNNVGDGATLQTVILTYDITEPICLSPFVFGDYDCTSNGFTGITQMNFTMNIDSLARRAFRWYSRATNKQVTGITFPQGQCWIECKFLTPHPSDLLPATCVTPYMQYNNFNTATTAAVNVGVSQQIVSANMQLNAIPDKLILFVKELYGNLSNDNADSYASITNVGINWNNNNNLLSGASQEALWKMSKEAGSGQSWIEFCGKTTLSPQTANGINAKDTPINATTTGSVLCLDFGKHIQIGEDFYAPGSGGQFNLQITVTFTNTTGVTLNPELNIVTIQSGIFVSQGGQSSTFTGILTKQLVLDASMTEEGIGRAELQRMVGSGFFSKLKHIARKVLPHIARHAKVALAQSNHPLAKVGHEALTQAGYGVSGGKLKKHLKTF